MEQITLNMIPKGITPMCHASQYDKGRHIRLNIMDGLQGYKLTDETAEIRVRKPDNNIVTAAGTYTAGTAYVDLFTTEQMTACEGDNECELRLTRGEQRIGSLNFKMRVEKDPLKDGIESESVIHNLEQEVADLVSEQYDADSVIFDDEPTEGHDIGYAVKSGALKRYIPKTIGALDDVNIDSPAGNQALVWNPTTQKWENGEVSTVGSIDDLDDVDTTGKGTGDSLRFDPDAGEAGEWVAQETVIPLTEQEYEALQEKQLCTFYAIDDGSPLDYTADDILYEEGGTETVHDKVESKANANLLTDYVKIKYFALNASDVTRNMDLSSNLSLDSGYKFLCYLPSILPDGFTTDQYLWLSAPQSKQGYPWWNTNPISGAGTNAKLRFFYLEIRDI